MRAEWQFHAKMMAFAIVFGLVMMTLVVPRLLERKRRASEPPATHTTTTILWDGRERQKSLGYLR